MYKAKGAQVFVTQDGIELLFLTVHDTGVEHIQSIEYQAMTIARILNGL